MLLLGGGMSNLQMILKGRNLGIDSTGRHIRAASGLSVRQLAKLLEIDPATLSRWERGESVPRSDSAIRWAQACDELLKTGSDACPD